MEYVCSYIQEVVFGTISWDYSNMAFNLNGRTSLLHCIFWGVCGVFYVIVAYPFILNFLKCIERPELVWVTSVTVFFMIFNIFISCAAGGRQNERVKNIPADNAYRQFLDKYYPDSVMDRIYANKIITKTREKNI